MPSRHLRAVFAFSIALVLCAVPASGLDPSFDDRVRAQESIERFHHARRSGSDRSFERLVTREALELRVRDYLGKLAALDDLWGLRIDGNLLDAEVRRIQRETGDPAGLAELAERIGGDPTVFRECVALPALVDRLARSRFAATAEDRPERTFDEWWRENAATYTSPVAWELAPRAPSATLEPFDAVDPGCVPDDSWVALPEPDGRWIHSAVWTGAEVIVWGGSADGADTDTGRRFDPVTANWTFISTVGAPSARQNHTAVWTGSEMIVWGNAFDRTGGRYNPTTDSWAPTTTVGAPEPRSWHTAVWTGSEMIVYGGAWGADPKQTGGRYDPVTDSWQPTAISNIYGSDQSAVWTGSEMIVWGGGEDFFSLGAGSSYDPVADSWTSISNQNRPQARANHAAVWTGSEMIVWGGIYYVTMSGISEGLDSGGRYDPALDSWTSTPMTGTPAPVRFPTAVWTGSEMIVWGSNPTTPSVGGRYDPALDAWTPVESTGSPQDRIFHEAVWTDLEMIVTGRPSSGAVPAEAGRYFVGNPDPDGDGVAGACDCAPLDPGRVNPDEVGDVAASRAASTVLRLSWDAVVGVDSYSVTRGSAASISSGSYGSCLASGIGTASYDDPLVPALGEAFTYLVQSEGASCGSSSLGPDSSGASRTNQDPQACP